MFYLVRIGLRNRKGNLNTQVEKVVEFDGNQRELYLLMVKQYNGFDVECYTIEKVEKVENEKALENTSNNNKRLTKHYSVSRKVLSNGAEVLLREVLPREILNELETTRKKLISLEDDATKIIKDKLNDRVEVSYVNSIRYDSNYKCAYVNLVLNCDLYLKGEE